MSAKWRAGPWWELVLLVLVVGAALVAVATPDLSRLWGDPRSLGKSVDLDELVVTLVIGVLGVYSWRRTQTIRREAGRLATVEHALSETAERYRSLVDYHPSAVFSLDLDGRFASVNPASEQLSGYRKDELLGSTFTDLLPAEERERMLVAFAALLDRRPQRLEVSFRHRSGSIGELSITGLPIVVGDEVEGVYVIAEDVSGRNRLRRDLDDALRSAEGATRAKSLFLANMSHEIRTPLTSVLAATELLADTELDELQEQLVRTMGRQGERLLKLVDQILDFSRIEAGKADVNYLDFDLRTMVADVVSAVAGTAEGKGLDLSVRVDDDLERRVTGDPARISQVLSNLVGNAVKFTDQGWVRIHVASVGSRADTGPVCFSVSDSGIGVGPERQDRLFESFSQGDASIARKYGGTGLGLAICRQLVRLMDGSINVTSNADMGSTFSFVVPLPPT